MLTDKLKLNDDNTEFMLIGTKQQLSKVNIDSLTVGSIDVAPVTVARNLGAWFDSKLNPHEQIQKACKSGFFHLHNIRRIRKCLSQELHVLWSTLLLWVILITATAFFLVYPLVTYLNCNACRMQQLGLYLVFLGTAT